MLSALIAQKVEQWFSGPDCPVRHLIEHIENAGFFRDAQRDAIRTYLYLKIAQGNRPLWQIFSDGSLNQNYDLSKLRITAESRAHFEANPAARALFEFSRMKTDSGTALLPKIESHLADHAADVDCEAVIKQMFYGVEYPDFLFSLPMGAGKTYLMAAFIYLDLYFASNEPENKTFAHNFILLVPSGLKSSIVPSLKTIEDFNPTWVLAEPAASNVKKLIRFEILDQGKAGSKSNREQSPNAKKISGYQPFENLLGLVVVTNAEKVILDRVRLTAQGSLIEESDDEKDKFANELRNFIGKIPNLQILIDEVHHAATDDVKLRKVVNNWSRGHGEAGGNINGVLGFSGTPYLSSAEEIKVANDVAMKFSLITNTVFYYPLTSAIKGFLKKPTVRTITEVDSLQIVRRGVEEFREKYGDKTYDNGTIAKLAIYCGAIARLEDEVFPLLLSMGIEPDDILKYHEHKKQYPLPASARVEWRMLDTALSRKRYILLVQIGKEGWDCRSLTGVILSQKGDCPTNMVLQTSCRCLRQMDGGDETAGIWLNADNAKTLDKQLKEEQHTSISEINNLGKTTAPPMRPRFSRVDRLQLPPVDFYQMSVHYDTVVTQEPAPLATIGGLDPIEYKLNAEETTLKLGVSNLVEREFLLNDRGEPADFALWLLSIAKGSFGGVTLAMLRGFEIELRTIFNGITYTDDGVLRFNALYDEAEIAARIRMAFHPLRTMTTTSEPIVEQARLLIVEKLHEVAKDKKNLYPSEADVDLMLRIDASSQTVEEYASFKSIEHKLAGEALKAQGFNIELPPLEPISAAVASKDRTFHYAPYQFDSSLELQFLEQALTLAELRDRNLELYFNGEGDLTQFRIMCYAQGRFGWKKVGWYTPDFLLIERGGDSIARAVIIETKGSGFADQRAFQQRRKFVETEFLKLNREKFGYDRFDYLYLSGDDDMSTNLSKLSDTVKTFFTD